MKTSYLLLFFGLIAVLASCDDPAEPGGRDDSSNIILNPPAGRFELEPFVWTQFTVVHRLRSAMEVTFRLDGEVVSESTTFTWTTPLPGSYEIRVDVRADDGQSLASSWTVDIVEEVSTPVPVVNISEVRRSEDPGAIILEFERPPASQTQVPIKEFLVHLRDEPFYEEGLEGTQILVVPFDPQVITQVVEIDGLEPGIVAWARVQVRDLMDRVGDLGPLRGGYVTDIFTVAGQVYEFHPETLSWSDAASLRLDWRSDVAMTGAGGSYELTGLSDFYSAPVYLSDPALRLRSMVTLPIGGDEPALDFYAFPLREYSMQVEGSTAENVDLSTVLRIFMRASNIVTNRPRYAYRWAEYPVRVFARDITIMGNSGEVVEYKPLIESAVAAWNEFSPIQLFALETDEQQAQVDFIANLTSSSSLLGSTRIVNPPGGELSEESPEKMLIRLREFNTNELASRIIRHELGHALCMGHSTDPSHLMYATVTADEPTALEAEIATYLSVLPQGIDLNLYRDE